MRLVADVNAAANGIFDINIKIKERRLFVRDPDARTHLKEAIDQLKDHSRLNSLALEPVIVPRMDKLPVIVRIWPFDGPAHQPGQEVHALLTLNALGPKPGPPAAILAKTFHLTPSEAKLACIIARGAPPDIAARELKISRETACNQLKAIEACHAEIGLVVQRLAARDAEVERLSQLPQWPRLAQRSASGKDNQKNLRENIQTAFDEPVFPPGRRLAGRQTGDQIDDFFFRVFPFAIFLALPKARDAANVLDARPVFLESHCEKTHGRIERRSIDVLPARAAGSKT
jgi:DNA-binding CsgD family transcriptional regulator